MKREATISLLREHKDELKNMGVEHLYLFGSVARDEAKPTSDVDLFFEYNDPHFSLIELVGLKNRLGALLKRRADVMTRGSLHPVLRDEIEKSAVLVF